MKTMRGYRNQRGASLVEALIVLIISAIAFGAGAQQYSKYLDNITNKQAADHATLIAGAASKYLKDNYAAVVASAGPTTPAVISVAMLKSTNYLPAGISDKNAFGQDYSIQVIEPLPNQVQAMVVTTGGQAISELDGRRIAQLMGAKGGFISTTDVTMATGSFGGWQMPLSPFAISPGAGHVATALFLEDGALVNDYLYRNAVPGHPELNRMNTAINMNGNNLSNAETVGATAVNTATLTATSDITAANAKVAGKLTSGGRTEVGEYLQLNAIATESEVCAPNGLVGRNGVGAPLSCQSGVWTSTGAKFKSYISGACQGYGGWNPKVCAIADSTWTICSLSGASAVGQDESGQVYRDGAGNWFLYAVRASWAGVFYWQCLK